MQGVTVNITDDDVSGEPVQQYDLLLTVVPSGVAIAPFSETTISIFDNDRELFQR